MSDVISWNFERGAYLCSVFECSGEGATRGVAVQTHWEIYGGRVARVTVWPVCENCIEQSRDFDFDVRKAALEEQTTPPTFLYLPIVSPVVGDEASLCMEAFFDAIGKLLRAVRDERQAA